MRLQAREWLFRITIDILTLNYTKRKTSHNSASPSSRSSTACSAWIHLFFTLPCDILVIRLILIIFIHNVEHVLCSISSSPAWLFECAESVVLIDIHWRGVFNSLKGVFICIVLEQRLWRDNWLLSCTSCSFWKLRATDPPHIVHVTVIYFINNFSLNWRIVEVSYICFL